MKTLKQFGLTLAASTFLCMAAHAAALDLSGTRLGETDHVKNANPKDTSSVNESGLDQSAIRIYLEKAPGEEGSYYGVLLQYSDFLKILPPYLGAHINPKINEKHGYLNQVIDKLSAYKLSPGKAPGTYEMAPVTVVDGKVQVMEGKKARLLTLAKDADQKDPLGGAKLSAGDTTIHDDREISFPKKGNLLTGVQYKLASTTYGSKITRLKSTWHGDFIQNDFLAAYAKAGDVVLDLSVQGGEQIAKFTNNDAKYPKEDRAKIFSNAKSVPLTGNYTVAEPVPGMFTLAPKGDGQVGAEELTGRIGLFVDIVDATVKLHQNVIEVGFVNPSDPKDFLMYYEDDNANAKKRVPQPTVVPVQK